MTSYANFAILESRMRCTLRALSSLGTSAGVGFAHGVVCVAGTLNMVAR